MAQDIIPISSDNLEIFPLSVYRENDGDTKNYIPYHDGRVLSEYNLTTLFNHLSEKSAFICNCIEPASSSTNTYDYECIIGGYFCKFKCSIPANTDTDIYASITHQDMQDSNKNTVHVALLDTGGEVKQGFAVTKGDAPTGTFAFIQIWDGTKKEVPSNSYARFSSKSIKHIDGGMLSSPPPAGS